MSQWKHGKYRRGRFKVATRRMTSAVELSKVKSVEGASRERHGNHKDSKARICKETPESRNKF